MIANLIDHTLLKSYASSKEISKLCDEYIEYNFRSICINPCWIRFAKDYTEKTYSNNIKVSTVIGFPLGSTFLETKIEETERAIESGVDEIDIVANIGKVKSNDFPYVEKELFSIIETARSNNIITKVIIETPVLNNEEKLRMIQIVDNSGADFIKTCTGFNGDCNPEDIYLMKQNSKNIKIKASGGIKSLSFFQLLRHVGADIIGTSKSIDILNEWKDSQHK